MNDLTASGLVGSMWWGLEVGEDLWGEGEFAGALGGLVDVGDQVQGLEDVVFGQLGVQGRAGAEDGLEAGKGIETTA